MRTATPAIAPGEPARIDPDGWYTDADLRLTLRLPGATLRAARRTGALQFSRRGVVTFHRGQWVIDWLSGRKVEATNV